MQDIIVILISSILVNNIVLTEFLGLSSLVKSASKIGLIIGLALATTLIITLATLANFAVDKIILQPLDIEYMRTLAFVVATGAVIPVAKILSSMTSKAMTNALTLFMPLIFFNSAVLGTSLLIINKNNSFVEAIFSSISVAIGFSLVLIIFNLLREKVSLADVPKPFKGAAIGLVTAGLMSLGFMGLIGLQ
jgi:electron transport complex protein RnfA